MEEKEKLNKNNDENNISEEEDNNEKDKNLNNEEKLKELFKLKENNKKDTTKIETNEVESFLLIKEKISKIRNMKLDANELLKNKKYEEAIDKYKETINTLLDEIYTLTNIELLESLKEEIIIPCYQNIALCYMKLNKWLKVKTYSKKVLGLNKENVKASYRICLANIKLGHLKKADTQLEDLERIIGGTPELEELEKIYDINKLNSEGNNGEFLRKMGRKLRDGKINMYSDKKSKIDVEKEKANDGLIGRNKNFLYNWLCCCKKKKKKVKI